MATVSEQRSLVGRAIPDVSLPSTAGGVVLLSEPGLGSFVLFAYPRTGRPDEPVPDGWASVPGASGCTLEAQRFAERFEQFSAAGFRIFGVSSQTPSFQAEAAARLRLPFPLLSDQGFELTDRLGLPTFSFEGARMLTRTTLVVVSGTIVEAEVGILDAGGHPAALLDKLP